MQFPQALETVLETLERLRDESGQQPCASRRALEALNRITPVPKSVMESPEPVGTITPNRPQSHVGSTESRPPNKATPKTNQLAAINERVCACVKCPNLAN